MTTFAQPTQPCRRGHLAPLYVWHRGDRIVKQCTECVRYNNAHNESQKRGNAAYLKARYQANPQWHTAKRREWSHSNPERTLWQAARRAAKIKNVSFDLRPEDIVIPAVCPVLGNPLTKGIKRRTAASPSLDRIIPEYGYTKGNVIVVSWRANRIKADATVDELRRVAEFYQPIATKD